MVKTSDFEKLLDDVVNRLTAEAATSGFTKPAEFELRVREVIHELGAPLGIDVNFSPHPHVFPDIVLGAYGVEVKFTTNDTWRSVANSVFESTKDPGVKNVYVLFGKMGGEPSVRWGKYDDCVMHVRTSHVPRFEVELYPEKSLFEQMGTSYEEFTNSSMDEKMKYVRAYARGRLKPGERLWWLGDEEQQDHTLPIQVRLYMNLEQDEKRKLRAEAALLCPQIVKPSRTRNKYNDATLYILTYHGVLCPQARDLFSAGSVALRADETRGGNYLLRALHDIQQEMRDAAKRLEAAVFLEYWGKNVPPDQRIAEWLRMADEMARDWKPSEHLFTD